MIKYRLWNFVQKIKAIYKYYKTPVRLEIHAADHCNLNCASCLHFSPVSRENYCDVELLRKSLGRLKRFHKVFEHINILGGEPLLNKDVLSICDAVRENFPDIRINFITNGLLLCHPDKLPAGFWQSIRENRIVLQMTRYPVNIDFEYIVNKCKEENVSYELTWDCSANIDKWKKNLLEPTPGEELLRRSKYMKAAYCSFKHCMQLVGDRLYACPFAAYIENLNRTFGCDFKVLESDYLSVSKIRSARQLRKYMLFAIPFCRYCKGGYTNTRWSRTGYKADEWIRQ